MSSTTAVATVPFPLEKKLPTFSWNKLLGLSLNVNASIFSGGDSETEMKKIDFTWI